jgi:hypothetical protein
MTRMAWTGVGMLCWAIFVVAQQPPGSGGIEGVWTFSTLTPLERPAEFAGRRYLTDQEAEAWVRDMLRQGNRDRRDGGAQTDVGRAVNDYWFERGEDLVSIDGRKVTSLVVDPPDGRIPPPPAGRSPAGRGRGRGGGADDPEARSLQERCLAFNAGPPILPGPYNNYVQILVFPDVVVIHNEMIHDARIVPLDGQPHVAPSIRQWLGDSRGRWEGGTLVVETTNFTDKVSVRGSDANMRLVERFSRADAQTLDYEFAVDDPTAFSAPWTVRLPMRRTDDRIFEYACHEGNYALPDILRGARAVDNRDPLP